jgi:hypothetical protein
MNSLTLKQLIAAMKVNQHSKWHLYDPLMFREKKSRIQTLTTTNCC